MKKVLSMVQKGGSLNYIFKEQIKMKGFADSSGEKSPKWVSELYQILSLGLGLAAFLSNRYLSSVEWLRLLVIFAFSYRIFETSVFILNWIFVEEEKAIHDYRRSLSGFLLNIVEAALYLSIITILISGSNLKEPDIEIFYKHIIGILTLFPPYPQHLILSSCEIIVSVLLILVVIGILASGLLRKKV